MYDAGKIITGLIIFIALFASPIWYDAISGKEALKQPELILPSRADQKECVLSAEYMRSNHMELLNDWRFRVVRQGERKFITAGHKTVDMSLSKTCFNCHTNTTQFCDRCHNYVGVSPYCWECHTEPHNPENLK